METLVALVQKATQGLLVLLVPQDPKALLVILVEIQD
jgi:hypothetical protein